MARLIIARSVSQAVAEARAAARRARMIAELGFLTSQLARLQAASRGEDTSDKAYAVEQRLNALVTQLGLGHLPNTDGNTYAPGPKTVRCTSDTTYNGTGQVAIPGLSVSLASGTDYIFEAWVPFTADSSTPSAFITMGGTCSVSAFKCDIAYLGGGAGAWVKIQTTLGANTGLDSNTLASGNQMIAVLHGHLACSGAGTLVVNGAASGTVSPDAFTVQNGADLRLWLDTS